MPVNLDLAPAVPVAGVSLATVACGVKSDGSNDLVLVELAEQATCAAVFTENAFAAAPVTIGREHLVECRGAVRALLINAGNANAGTGQPGIAMARGHCEAVAGAMGIATTSVLPFSTGVIGQLLPDAKMRAGIADAAGRLRAAKNGASADVAPDATAGAAASTSPPMSLMANEEAWQQAARGIMTTDTVPKLTSRVVTLADGSTVTVTGMAKGAGMIEPHMATMLAYVYTDAAVTSELLDATLRAAVDVSFNAISVDGDTSTNDACVLCATGAAATLSPADGDDWQAFDAALKAVFIDLAQAIVRDAEGATKFITVDVSGGRDIGECRQVAYAIANSPLVKTAMFASDANVGRLLMAIGKAGVAELDVSGVEVSIGDVPAFRDGGIADGYTEEKGALVMEKAEIRVAVGLGRGDARAEIYTSDLSHDYVSINADYRS